MSKKNAAKVAAATPAAKPPEQSMSTEATITPINAAAEAQEAVAASPVVEAQASSPPELIPVDPASAPVAVATPVAAPQPRMPTPDPSQPSSTPTVSATPRMPTPAPAPPTPAAPAPTPQAAQVPTPPAPAPMPAPASGAPVPTWRQFVNQGGAAPAASAQSAAQGQGAQAQPQSPSASMVLSIFDAIKGDMKCDDQTAAINVMMFLTECVVFSVGLASNDIAKNATMLLKSLGDTVAKANVEQVLSVVKTAKAQPRQPPQR